MKKISFFLILCTITVLAACSKEDSINFNSSNDGFKQKNTDLLLNLYTKMINSQSYKNEQAALNLFIVKMDFNGNPSDIQGDTETDMLLWISNNLSTTSFTSYGAAVSEWENIIVLGTVAFQKNKAFYDELRVNPGGYSDIIPAVGVPVTPNACPACKTAFNNCTNAANKTYANKVESISNDHSNNLITENQSIRNKEKAKVKLTEALQTCKETFFACCNNS